MIPSGEPTRTDQIFAALRRAVPRAQPRKARQNAWILEATCRLINERVSARQDTRYGWALERRLKKEVKKILAIDRRQRADEAGAEVEALMKADPPLIQEVWYRHQGWYKAAFDRTPPPARATLKQITAERVALYSRVRPPGDSIPVNINPFAVENGVPDEGEIKWAVKHLQKKPSRGAVVDVGGGPKGLARGGTEMGEERGNRKKRGGRPGGHTRGGKELGEGGGVGADGVLGWRYGLGGDLACGSTYPQGKEGLPGLLPY